MANNDKDEILSTRYAKNSFRADLFAYPVIAGLAVEISGIIILRPPFWEAFFSILGSALIVIGVWGEIIFGRWAKEAGDGIVAEANASAAKALERAATLEKEAAEARERAAQIELLTMPRRISLEQRNKIADAIRGKTPDIILIRYSMFDNEATLFALELNDVFIEANSAPPNWARTADLNKNNLTFGLFIASEPDIYASLIIQAFRDAGIVVTHGLPGTDSFPEPTRAGTRMFIYVGHKPLVKSAYGFLASRE